MPSNIVIQVFDTDTADYRWIEIELDADAGTVTCISEDAPDVSPQRGPSPCAQTYEAGNGE
mgnify:CR=1 FL=1